MTIAKIIPVNETTINSLLNDFSVDEELLKEGDSPAINVHFTKSGFWIVEHENGKFSTLGCINSAYGTLQDCIDLLTEHYGEEEIEANKVQLLSTEFSAIINEWLTPDEIKEVNERNKVYDANICATHDFCDPNEAMAEAFIKVFGREFIFYNDEEPETEKQNEIDSTYFNLAWDLSKKNDFKTV